jgi:hypothetical protein
MTEWFRWFLNKSIIGFSGLATIENTHITLNEIDIQKIMEKDNTAK